MTRVQENKITKNILLRRNGRHYYRQGTTKTSGSPGFKDM